MAAQSILRMYITKTSEHSGMIKGHQQGLQGLVIYKLRVVIIQEYRHLDFDYVEREVSYLRLKSSPESI